MTYEETVCKNSSDGAHDWLADSHACFHYQGKHGNSGLASVLYM
jgi:hypothetical protein